MNETQITPHSVYQRLMQINRLHRSTIDSNISKTGIHRSQHMILMYLNRCDSKVSQKAIAEHFEISPAAVAVTLKKLENGGYIKRTSSENDSRFNEIEITKKGNEVVDYSHKVFDEIDMHSFEGISVAEREVLCNLLDKIVCNLKQTQRKDEI